jgi:hypothetical protein
MFYVFLPMFQFKTNFNYSPCENNTKNYHYLPIAGLSLVRVPNSSFSIISINYNFFLLFKFMCSAHK